MTSMHTFFPVYKCMKWLHHVAPHYMTSMHTFFPVYKCMKWLHHVAPHYMTSMHTFFPVCKCMKWLKFIHCGNDTTHQWAIFCKTTLCTCGVVTPAFELYSQKWISKHYLCCYGDANFITVLEAQITIWKLQSALWLVTVHNDDKFQKSAVQLRIYLFGYLPIFGLP